MGELGLLIALLVSTLNMLVLLMRCGNLNRIIDVQDEQIAYLSKSLNKRINWEALNE